MKRFTDGRFYVAEKISPRRSKTPEGFLLCEAVPISRTGEFAYTGAETGIPAEGGRVMLTRTAGELFSPQTVASFEGKPVVIGHRQFADPTNWRRIAIGTVQNVRPGTGGMADCLLADLLITDAEGIRLIESGEMTEVSCGYDADLIQDARGRGHVEGIVGNHVALVEAARCGERCSIGDAMSISFKAILRRAFRAGDEDAFNEALDKVDIEEKEIEDEAPDAAPEGEDKLAALEKRLAEVERMLAELKDKAAPAEVEDEAPEEEEAPAADPDADVVPDDEAEREIDDARTVFDCLKRPVGDAAGGKFTRGMLDRMARRALKDGGVTLFGDPAELSGPALTVALRGAAEIARTARNPKAVQMKDGRPERLSVAEMNRNYWESR